MCAQVHSPVWGKRFVADWMPNGRSSVFLGRETDTDTDATADTDTDT